MLGSTFTLEAPDGEPLFTYCWLPDAAPQRRIKFPELSACGLAHEGKRLAMVSRTYFSWPPLTP